jgi:ribosomal protein S6--L-glutamate ligase
MEKMIIGICSTRNHRYHPNRRLLEAAGQLGHSAKLLHPGKYVIGLEGKEPTIDPVRGSLKVDVILPRIGASIREYGLSMIRHLEVLGFPVFNPYQSILLASNKFLSLQTLSRKGIPITESQYVSNWNNFKKGVALLGGYPLVAKESRGRQGKGVFLLTSAARAEQVLEGVLDQGRGVLLQPFFPTETRRDIRLIVAGDRVLGAMSLTPGEGEFRANVHLGGRAKALKPTRAMLKLAIKSTRALGLDISGVDMIEIEGRDLKIAEVNYSPGFRGMEKCTGRDIAVEIIKYVTKVGRHLLCT